MILGLVFLALLWKKRKADRGRNSLFSLLLWSFKGLLTFATVLLVCFILGRQGSIVDLSIINFSNKNQVIPLVFMFFDCAINWWIIMLVQVDVLEFPSLMAVWWNWKIYDLAAFWIVILWGYYCSYIAF